MDGSLSQESNEPIYFVVRLPGDFCGYYQSNGFQTVVLAKTAGEAFESACETNSWEILPFDVEQVHVFPKEVKI